MRIGSPEGMPVSSGAAPIDVLIADDQADVLDALRLLLRPEGIDTHAASSPADVLEALGRQEFDLLLMDLNYARDTTSGREGLDLLSQVRALDAHLPIVVMTGWGTMEVAVEAMRHGVRDFVQKPWDNDRVVSVVRSLAEGRRAERRTAARWANELREAREIQRGLLPPALPALPGWQMAAACEEAASVGGDLFDVVPLDGTRLALAIGDVAGKGIPAALLAANLQAAVRAALAERSDPAEVCSLVNRSLCAVMPNDRFITFFFGVLETSSGLFRYCNAGHNPPLIIGDAATGARLGGGGLVLGVERETRYETSVTTLAPGDALLLYTDGITEACNDAGEEFGESRLAEIVGATREQGATAVRDAILEAVRTFAVERSDDRTLLVLCHD